MSPSITSSATCWYVNVTVAPCLVRRGVIHPIDQSAGCCARAAYGHAVAPPSSDMNARRVESRTGAVAWAIWQHSVSCPRSSNRTCRFPASGFPTSFIVRHTEKSSGRKRPLRGGCPPRSVTTYNCIYHLRRAAELLAPTIDFSWLAEVEKDLALVMEPRTKFDRLVLTELHSG